MAESDSEDISREGKPSNKGGLMKCCNKNTSIVVCRKCSAVFHKSCTARSSKYKQISDGIIECPCEVINMEGNDHYLKELLKAKDEIIQDKSNIVSLQEQLIDQLRSTINDLQEQLKIKNKTNTTCQSKVTYSDITKNLLVPTIQNQQKNSLVPTQDSTIELSKNRNLEVEKQISDKIQLKDVRKAIEEQQRKEENFKAVHYSQRKKKIAIGENKISDEEKSKGFAGREVNEKKIWLFVSRVKDHVTEPIIKRYLAKKTNFTEEEFVVKEIETYKKIENNKCFQIGVNPSLKDQVYNKTFWPEGVAHSRFNFHKFFHKDPNQKWKEK